MLLFEGAGGNDAAGVIPLVSTKDLPGSDLVALKSIYLYVLIGGLTFCVLGLTLLSAIVFVYIRRWRKDEKSYRQWRAAAGLDTKWYSNESVLNDSFMSKEETVGQLSACSNPGSCIL